MTPFRRLVLELGHGAVDPEVMRQAAMFAHLMDAELHALFVEDETLLHASALPFTREISSLSCQWRPLEPARLEAELRADAEWARERLAEVARAIGIRRSFEVRRGNLSVHVGDTCVATDIVVISASGGAGTTRGDRRLSDTAQRTAASMLFLPAQSVRRQGAVVAVIATAEDPALEVARRIAVQEREQLLVLAPFDGGIEGNEPVRALAGRSVPDVLAALADARERLIVLTRIGTGAGAELAAARGVPVFMLEAV
jgi:hypothetical protein